MQIIFIIVVAIIDLVILFFGMRVVKYSETSMGVAMGVGLIIVAVLFLIGGLALSELIPRTIRI